MNKCPKKYLWQIYSNIQLFKYVRYTLVWKPNWLRDNLQDQALPKSWRYQKGGRGWSQNHPEIHTMVYLNIFEYFEYFFWGGPLSSTWKISRLMCSMEKYLDLLGIQHTPSNCILLHHPSFQSPSPWRALSVLHTVLQIQCSIFVKERID